MYRRDESDDSRSRYFGRRVLRFHITLSAILLSLTAAAWSESGAERVTGDFNGSSRVDFADFLLFSEAFGGTDPTYDLNGNGRVDFEDLFLFSDHFGKKTTDSFVAGENAAAAILPEPVIYTTASTSLNTTLQFPTHRIVVQNGRPFGIMSLRLAGQPVDFVHPTLPMGDWEWFRFERPDTPGKQFITKLIQPEWRVPVVERQADQVVLRFGRKDIFQEGIFLYVTYRLRADRPEFAIEYEIRNQSVDHLDKPYVMLGFPGFSDHRWISQVAIGTRVRPVKPPHFNFFSEAQAEGKVEYLLLRQDVDPRGSERELMNVLSLQMGPTTYTLTVFYDADSSLRRVYSAHTNKPRYLTSHLYAFLTRMAPGESRSLTVHYKLSIESD